MPIFEYQCQQCGTVIEKIQSKPLADIPCPACSQPARRRVSRTALSIQSSSCSSGGHGGFT